MSGAEVETPIYFGCPPGRPAGHYYHLPDGSDLYRGNTRTPWGEVDGKLQPKDRDALREQGAALLHHQPGWTALAFCDYRGDSRGNSNTVILIPEPGLTFDAALAVAVETFPRWMAGANVHEVPAVKASR